jgi:hypothetical protein
VEFELTARNGELIPTRGRITRPAVIFQTSGSTLTDIVRGQITVTDAVEQGDASLKGSKAAVRRMFATIGFPLARLDPEAAIGTARSGPSRHGLRPARSKRASSNDWRRCLGL